MLVRKLCLISLPLNFLFSAGNMQAQQPAKTKSPVYIVTDDKPQFPGGKEGLQAYFDKNLNTKKVNKREVVTVSLVVLANGQVKDASIGKGINPETDSLVIRAVRKMPAWQPGKTGGKAVNARVLFPVVFEPAETVDLAGGNYGHGIEDKNIRPYIYVEQMPQFPGGENMLNAFIRKHLQYPEADKKQGTTGRVVIEVVITETGQLANIKTLLPLSATAEAEAIRVIKLMPLWQPGKQNGRIVPVKVNLTFKFPPHDN